MLCVLLCNAQNPDAASRGGAIVADSGLWVSNTNPASIISAGRFDAAIAYRNYYFVPELHSAALYCSWQKKQSALGITASNHVGYPAWNKQQISATYSIILHPCLRAGIAMQCDISQMTGITAQYSIWPRVGILYLPAKWLSLGFCAANPFTWQSSLTPTELRLGIQSSYYEKCTISAQCDKDISHPAIFRFGCIYSLHQRFTARLGFASGNNPLTYGLGIVVNKWSAIVAIEHHLQLGGQPSAGLLYRF